MTDYHATNDLRWTHDTGVLEQRWTRGEPVSLELSAPLDERPLPSGRMLMLFAPVDNTPGVGAVVTIDGKAARVTDAKDVAVMHQQVRAERLALQVDWIDGEYGDEWREVPTAVPRKEGA